MTSLLRSAARSGWSGGQRGELGEQRREVGVVGVARLVSHGADDPGPADGGGPLREATRGRPAGNAAAGRFVGPPVVGRAAARRSAVVRPIILRLEGETDPVSHSASPVLGPSGHPAPGDGAENGSADDGLGDVDGLGYERRYVAMLYDRLDERRADTARRLAVGAARRDRRHPAGPDRARRRGRDVHRPARRRCARPSTAWPSAGSTPTTASGATSAAWACSTRSATTSRC